MRMQNASLLWTVAFCFALSTICVTANKLHGKKRNVEAAITGENGGMVEKEPFATNSEDLSNDETSVKAYRECKNVIKKIVISLPTSPVLAKNNLIGVVNEATGNYKLSFEIVPRGVVSEWSSILHFTTGANCCNFGARSPALWFSPGKTDIAVVIGDSADGNWHTYTHALTLHARTKVTLESNGNKITLTVGGKLYHLVQPTHRFAGKLLVYAGDPWHQAANAEIYGLEYEILPATKAKADMTLQSDTYGLEEDRESIANGVKEDNYIY